MKDEFNPMVECPTCQGDNDPRLGSPCPTCHGLGKVRLDNVPPPDVPEPPSLRTDYDFSTAIAATLQPRPQGTGKAIGPLVIADLQARIAKGTHEYGQPLKAHNGRIALIDLYQELLDAAMYLRQYLEETGGLPPEL